MKINAIDVIELNLFFFAFLSSVPLYIYNSGHVCQPTICYSRSRIVNCQMCIAYTVNKIRLCVPY